MRKRAFFIGILFAAAIGMLDPYLMLKGLSGRFCWEYWAPAAIFGLFAILLLSSLHRIFELRTPELLLIFIMASTASVLPSMGFMASFIPVVSGLKYFATSANQWQEYIIDRAFPLLMVQDEKAVEYFYEGLPPGAPVPYEAWLAPMGFVLLFVLVFAFLSICVMVLFRKQWIEKEKLIYPLTILPLEMVKKKNGSRVPALFKNKLFWLAFSLAFLYYLANWISSASTGTVMIRLTGRIVLMRKAVTMSLRPHLPIIGFAYLIPRSVSLSLWLFYVLFSLQTGIFSSSGFMLPGSNEHFCGRSAATTFEGGGAMLVLAVVLVWRARKHLRDCFLKAFTGASAIDDSGEMLSYRTAVIGAAVSFAGMVCFLRAFGMPWISSFLFIFFVMIVFLGLTRIVCQVGLPAAQAQCTPPAYAAHLLPPGLVTPGGYVAMGLQYSWAGDIRTSIMATTGHSLRIQEEARIPRRILFAGILSAIVISYVAAAWVYISTAYGMGALNISTSGGGGAGPWFFGGSMARVISNFIIPKITNPMTREIIVSRYVFTGIGAVVMSVLIFLHSRFLWWPIHFIGFPIAESQPLQYWWFAIFLAWLVKGVILKFGGHNVYNKSVPFFLGLILGDISWMVMENVLNFLFDKAVYVGG